MYDLNHSYECSKNPCRGCNYLTVLELKTKGLVLRPDILIFFLEDRGKRNYAVSTKS
jgi:hypothetical protein